MRRRRKVGRLCTYVRVVRSRVDLTWFEAECTIELLVVKLPKM